MTAIMESVMNVKAQPVRLSKEVRQMLKVTGVSPYIYKKRMAAGWSKEDAMYTAKNDKPGMQRSIYHVPLEHIPSMIKNNLTMDEVRYRLAIGWPMDEAVSIPKKRKKKM